jgi:hypothetical protein
MIMQYITRILLISIFGLFSIVSANGQTIRKFSVGEISLRKRATKNVIPKYPKVALKKNRQVLPLLN